MRLSSVRPITYYWLAALVSLAVLPSLSLADSLTGRAVDPQGNSVANARLNLFDRNNGEQRSTSSNQDGVYTFQGIPPGNYVLEVVASGSALIASQDIAVKGDSKLDIGLKVAGTQTEVIVTASSTPLSITEIAKAVDVVDSEQIHQRAVFQISEALRLLPGLQVQTLEGPGSWTKVRTRGLRTTDTVFLFDGMRFRDAGSTNFYTRLRQTITSITLPPGDVFGRTRGYVNGGGGIARGVELSAQFSPARGTSIQGSYTFANSDQNTPTVAGTSYYKILDLSPHTYTFSVTQWVGRRFRTTFDFYGRSDYVTTLFGGGSRLFVFNGEEKANIVLGYETPLADHRSMEFYGKVENLLNQQQYQDGYIGPTA